MAQCAGKRQLLRLLTEGIQWRYVDVAVGWCQTCRGLNSQQNIYTVDLVTHTTVVLGMYWLPRGPFFALAAPPVLYRRQQSTSEHLCRSQKPTVRRAFYA